MRYRIRPRQKFESQQIFCQVFRYLLHTPGATFDVGGLNGLVNDGKRVGARSCCGIQCDYRF